MIRVHICEGGEYECTHYEIHAESECDPRYHPPYVEALMRVGMVRAIQSAFVAAGDAESALEELFKAGVYRPGSRAMETKREISHASTIYAIESAVKRYGARCTECGIPFWEPSQECPHQLTNVHPLARKEM